MNNVKYMDIQEFRETGFLQEVNRLFFHPHGLALEIVVEEDGTEHLGGIWDYREDPEGIWFDWASWDDDAYVENGAWEKYERVLAERRKHSDARYDLLHNAYENEYVGDIEPVLERNTKGQSRVS